MVGTIVRPQANGTFKRRKGFLIFVDKDGRVKETPMKRRGKKRGR